MASARFQFSLLFSCLVSLSIFSLKPVLVGVVLFVLLQPGLLFQIPGYNRSIELGGTFGAVVAFERVTSLVVARAVVIKPCDAFQWHKQGFKTRPFWAGMAELTRILALPFRVRAKMRGGERVTMEQPLHPSWNGERMIGPGKERQFSEEKIYDSFGFRTNLLALLPRIEQEESSTIGDSGAFEQPRIVEEEQTERAVAEQIERETNRGNEADPPN
ncbi:hypothetical protein Cgig2_004268 [Carnegiea gigantea]|uniref:Uncharacterized protein n=1 Tax=Carnegiea gigantea TaxID=171969 RepID=A0A9Q1KGR4_9CARY|nr:hypothetical protein Cgig2_004268 [Carnegiea gigantea]